MAEGHGSATIQRFPTVSALYRQNLDPTTSASEIIALGVALRRLDQAVARLQKAIKQQAVASESQANGGDISLAGLSINNGFSDRAHQFLDDFKMILVDCEMILSDGDLLEMKPEKFSQSMKQELIVLQRNVLSQNQKLLLFLTEIPPMESSSQAHHVAPALSAPRFRPPTNGRPSVIPNPFALPQGILQRLRQMSMRNSPPGFSSPEEFPIRLGLDALAHHLQQSTTQSAPGIPQTAHQYLSLLKMQWIVQCIEQLPAFKSLDLIDREKEQVFWYRNTAFSELRRNDLSRFREEDLVNLPDHFYVLWPPVSTADHLHNPMQARNGEKAVLTLTIPSRSRDNDCTLRVLRILKSSSGTAVRIVRKRANVDPEDVPVDTFKDSLIPLYAFRHSRCKTYGLVIRKADYREGPYYEFNNTADLYKMQRTLTNYTVVSDFVPETASIDWAVARPVLAKKAQGEATRLQIWLWDPDDTLSQTANEAGYGGDNESRQSIVSHLTAQSALTILHDSGNPHVSASARDRRKYTNTEVVEAVMPYEPLLVIYTEHAGQYCFLSLELSSQIIIDPTTCNCTKRPEKCNRVVLKNRTGELILTRIKAKSNSPDGVPVLNLFARSFRKGQAAHPALRDERLVERFQGGHIAIDFPTVELRKTFNQHFTLAYKLRSSIESTDQILETRARFLADRPEGSDNPRERIVGLSQSHSLRSQDSLSSSSYDGSSGGRHRSSISDYGANGARSSRASSFATEHSRHNSGPSITLPLSELADRNLSPTELHAESSVRQPASLTRNRRRLYSHGSHDDAVSPPSTRFPEVHRSSEQEIISPLSPRNDPPLRRAVPMGRSIDPGLQPRQPASKHRQSIYELP